jgi:hypothetical protein
MSDYFYGACAPPLSQKIVQKWHRCTSLLLNFR